MTLLWFFNADKNKLEIILETKQIIISEINIEDHTYKISSDIDITGLSLSIKEIGLINPLVLKKQNNGYIIVSGFRRIKAMINNNIIEAAADIIPENSFRNNEVMIAVAENAFQRPLNTMEQVRSVILLERIMDRNEIAEKSMSIFNLKMNTSFVDRLFIIGSMPGKIHSLIEAGDLSMTVSLRLNQYDSDTVNAFISVFKTIKLGLNKQMEIITNIHEIAARENSTPLVIIKSNEIGAIINDDNLDRQQKGGLLRSFLLKRRYPHIKEAEERFKINLKKLKLSNQLNLHAPGNFEAMDYRFSFKFKNYIELEKRIKKLEEVICNPILKKMIS